VDRHTPLEFLEHELTQRGEPFYAPNSFVDSLLLDRAEQGGVRTIIDGLDGDTAVGHGWEFLGELFRRGRLRRVWRLSRALGEHTEQHALKFVWSQALQPTLLGLWQAALGSRSVRVSPLLHPDFARKVDYRARLSSFHAQRLSTPLSSFRRQHWAMLASALIPMCFEIVAVQAGARGIVRRHPYYDRRLLEFCVSLPGEQRFDRGADRLIQRRAVEGFTPEPIRRRLSKSVWAQNTIDRLRHDERVRLERWVSGELQISDYVNRKVLRKSVSSLMAGSANPHMIAGIWIAYILDLWLTRHT
jgi:asparagine synthase (glutamine-hydrolysing)